MWLLAHQKRNSGIVESHRSIHHPSSGRVSHHLFSLLSFLKIIYTYREGEKISIASHLKDIVRGRTRCNGMCNAKNQGKREETKKQKTLGGWMKETINCMAGKEENDVWRNRSMCVLTIVIPFPPFHQSFLVVSNWFTDPVSADGRQLRILYMGEPLKNGENLISSSLVVFPTLPRHSRKDEPTDCATVSLVFEFLLLFSRRKQIPFWHFSLFLLELITFSLGCVCRGGQTWRWDDVNNNSRRMKTMTLHREPLGYYTMNWPNLCCWGLMRY